MNPKITLPHLILLGWNEAHILLGGDEMAYRIDYTSDNGTNSKKCFTFRLPVLTLFCLILFVFLVEQYWPEGTEVLEHCAAWAGSLPPVSGLRQAAADFRNGEPVLQVFSTFFQTLQP